MVRIIAACLLLVCCSIQAYETESRNSNEVVKFKRTHVCPSTHVAEAKPCPGYIVDHMMPICLQHLFPNSLDVAANMQYQTKADAALKDKQEWAACRRLRKLEAKQ